ncbi:MAG: histidine--tRNA ligase [Actinobacteria bacterium]|nr:histidine--tRNA ligase [Actinomycetota bacterium]
MSHRPWWCARLALPVVPSFQTSPGTRDILPPQAGRWRAFSAQFADIVESAGYECIIPPMFEDLGVFLRLGDATDVVTKEMYDFEDKGGRRIALRPEHTAGICRAFAQHRPTTPWKVWYSGSNFRYEKAQAGRFRQFDQVGIEVLGSTDPLLDVEVIAMGWQFFESLGLKNVVLMVNSLGDLADRAAYIEALRQYLESRSDELSDEAKATLQRNPLRVLDSKRAQDKPVVIGAPTISEFLSDEARAHFVTVIAGLDALNIPYTINAGLVRGLDYYQRTVFEFVSTSLDSAQTAVGGGGRYDGLVEDLGGPTTPGVGFALGIDRTLLACDSEEVFNLGSPQIDAFIVDVVDGMSALRLSDELRAAGFTVDRAYDGRSMKSQMKVADRSGARVAIIIGPDEAEAGNCTVRNLMTSDQSIVVQAELVTHLASIVGERNPRRNTQ